MRFATKRIRVIQATKEEIAALHKVLVQAEEGRTVNYGETKLADGSYLGVSMMSHAEQQADAQSTREANMIAESARRSRNNSVADEFERQNRSY